MVSGIRRPRASLSCFVFASVIGTVACGGAYEPSRASHFEAEPTADINDEDVRKAFDARPQLGEGVRVAYYTFDPERADDMDAMLQTLPGVSSVYRIPPLIVTGQRRFQQQDSWQPPREISVKKLRVLAAHAHA